MLTKNNKNMSIFKTQLLLENESDFQQMLLDFPDLTSEDFRKHAYEVFRNPVSYPVVAVIAFYDHPQAYWEEVMYVYPSNFRKNKIKDIL